jgi:phosphatidylinositol glycan class V
MEEKATRGAIASRGTAIGRGPYSVRGENTAETHTSTPRLTMPTRSIFHLAMFSRCLMLFLMVVHDIAFRDLSSSAHLQQYPCHYEQVSGQSTGPDAVKNDISRSQTPFLNTIETSMASMTPWDSVYFVRIAQCGYESDQIFAFFPLLPMLMRVGGAVAKLVYACACFMISMFSISPMRLAEYSLGSLSRQMLASFEGVPLEVTRIGMVTTGLIVNIASFCAAAIVLYDLGKRVLKDEKVAWVAAVVFCFNPASVFYSAVYTESLFSLLSWMGMLCVIQGKYWRGVGWLALAGSARSNGILGVWFLIWEELIWARKIHVGHEGSFNTSKRVIRVLFGSIVVCLPYIGMQAIGWLAFCRQASVGDRPLWCEGAIPSIYGYIQQEYWDVGFLNFYQKLIRLPFVVQSIPVIALSVSACWTWTWAGSFQGNERMSGLKRALSLGWMDLDIVTKNRIASRLRHSACIVAPHVTPFVMHLALMTFVSVFVMHVNVATRFLSSSPLLFWYASQWILNGKDETRSRFLFAWCAIYGFMGSLMFPNFYPWV